MSWLKLGDTVISAVLSILLLSYFGTVSARFYGVDPKEFNEQDPQSFNRYSYGNNNPYKYVDPDGREVIFFAEPPFLARPLIETLPRTAAETAPIRPTTAIEPKVGPEAVVRPGSRGGPEHQKTIQRRIDLLEEQGYRHLNGGEKTEEVVRTPEGCKTCRRPDVTMEKPDGSIYRENIGRTTREGEPVAPERRALDDIEKATGERPGYTPYDK